MALQQATDELVAAAYQDAVAARRVHHVPRLDAAALCRRRSREGQHAQRAAVEHLRSAAGESRLGLCQRFQRLRPHVPGAGPGRGRVPPRRRRHSPAENAQRAPARWCRSVRWSNVEWRSGPDRVVRYNMYPGRRSAGRRRRRLQLGRRDGDDRTHWPPRCCRRA